MGLIALLSAIVVGAVSATKLSIFAFVIALSAVFVLGVPVAIVIAASSGGVLWMAIGLFAATQVGYALGMAAMALFRPRFGRTTSPSRPRIPFRVRK